MLTNEANLTRTNASMIDDLASSLDGLIESHELGIYTALVTMKLFKITEI